MKLLLITCRYIIGSLLVLAVVNEIVKNNTAQPQAIKANTIVREYVANEAKANEVYRHKRVKVRGYIDRIGKDFVMLSTGHSFGIPSISAGFEAHHRDAISMLQLHQLITLECIGGGLFVHVIMYNCLIL